MNLSKYNPIVARFLFALLFGYAATQAHACDCNKAADRAKYPAQCGITTTGAPNANQTQSAQANASSASASNAAAQSASQSGANAAGGSVGTISSNASGGTGGAGGNGGNSQSSASANATGNSGAAASGNSTSYSESFAASRIPANTALAAMGITTAACRFAEGVGIQLIPGGASVGITLKDHDCVRFQIAQFFYSRGNDLAGDHVICQIAEVRKDLGDDCLAYLAQEHAPVDAVTHSELRELEKRIESRTLAK